MCLCESVNDKVKARVGVREKQEFVCQCEFLCERGEMRVRACVCQYDFLCCQERQCWRERERDLEKPNV